MEPLTVDPPPKTGWRTASDGDRYRVNLCLHTLTALLLLVCVAFQLTIVPQLYQMAAAMKEDRKAWQEHEGLMQGARQRSLNLQMELQAQQEENLRIAREIAKAQHKGE